jgi:hypothetical protein
MRSEGGIIIFYPLRYSKITNLDPPPFRLRGFLDNKYILIVETEIPLALLVRV